MSDETKTETTPQGGFKPINTQEEFDKAIQARLARAEAKKEAEAATKLAEMEGKLTAANAQADALKKTSVSIEEANKALEDTYKGITEGMNENLRALIPEELSIAGRIKHINRNREVFFPKPITQPNGTPPPVMPNANGDLKAPPVESTRTPLPQQYASLAEFQFKDPKGAKAWTEANARQGVS